MIINCKESKRRNKMTLKTLLNRGLAVLLTASFMIIGVPSVASASDIEKKTGSCGEDILTDSNAPTQLTFGQETTGTANETNIASYIFTVGAPGRLTLTNLSDKGEGLYYNITENDSPTNYGKLDWYPNGPSLPMTSGEVAYLDVIPGTYHLFIKSHEYEPEYSTYRFVLDFTPVAVNPGEELLYDEELGGINNEKETAKQIEIGKKYRAFISEDSSNEKDWYKFTVTKKTTLYLSAGTNDLSNGSFRLHNGEQDLGLKGEQPTITDQKSLIGYKMTVMYAPWKNNKPSADLPAGTYYLEAQPVNSTGTYSFSLTTKAPTRVSKLSVKPNKLNMSVGETSALKATVKPANAFDTTVSYTSSDPLVAIVEPDGNITAISSGIATITVTTNSPNKKGKQLSTKCQVKVK